MILPPAQAKEFLIYRAATSWEYEVFVFPVELKAVLDGFASGVGAGKDVCSNVKSYLFEDINEMVTRTELFDWATKIGMADPEEVVVKARSWRLLHCIVPGVVYPPAYQGHPMQEANWARMPTPIVDRGAKVKRDRFDPLTYLEDLTFSLDEFL